MTNECTTLDDAVQQHIPGYWFVVWQLDNNRFRWSNSSNYVRPADYMPFGDEVQVAAWIGPDGQTLIRSGRCLTIA